jgi:hypothetical protein
VGKRQFLLICFGWWTRRYPTKPYKFPEWFFRWVAREWGG